MTKEAQPLILFCYPGSIFSDRVKWYMKLSQIPHYECIQPPIMPRPDLAALDIAYRRIPLMTVGRDVYCDSRLILKYLEEHFPLPHINPNQIPYDQGLAHLFQIWTHDTGVFWTSTRLIPSTSGFLSNPSFVADRSDLTGMKWTAEDLERGKLAALARMKTEFGVLEATILADGRPWLAGGSEAQGPTLADIEAIYPLRWIIVDPLMEDGRETTLKYITEAAFPKTFAWIHRFERAIAEAGARAPKPGELAGEQAVQMTLGSPATAPPQAGLDRHEPLPLKEGQVVEVWNKDQATRNADRGKLVLLTDFEICIENIKGLRLHFPRLGYGIEAIST